MADKDKDTTEAPEELEESAAAEEEASEDASADEEDEFSFVEDPSYDVEYKGDCAYEVNVSIPPANTAEQANKMFDELKSEAEVPGFRPGRAPRKLIERKFAKVVRGEVETKLVTAAFHKLVKDEDLKPISMPDIDGVEEAKDRKDDEPLAFALKFEVSPRVELGTYRGIDVEKPILKVGKEDVKSAIEEMRGRYSTFEALSAKGKAKDGDQLIIDFKGTVDGDEFPGGTAQAYPYILGTKRFFPEFEEALKGVSAGKEVTCTVTLPEDGTYLIVATRFLEADGFSTGNYRLTLEVLSRDGPAPATGVSEG
ncbi:MAG: trigger factor [bacterium]|nr:trigger factor [bacterium]